MDSTMTETLRNEEALFIPSEDNTENTYIPKVAGDYVGHVTHLKSVVREFKRDGRKFKARIYNFKVLVAPENTHNHYTYTDRDGAEHQTSGKPYVGWDIIANGVFRFLEPGDGDNFESNAEENVRYLRFCQALGLTITTEKRTVGDKTVNVQLLPTLTETDVNGIPVTAVVGRGKDWVNNEGDTVPSWRVKFIKSWEDGKRLASTTTDDLPF